MNTGRFLTFVELLLLRERHFKVQDGLAELQAAISNLTTQPPNPNYQSEVSRTVASVRERAEALATSMTPAQMDMLADIEGGEMLSPSIGEWISNWIVQNAMTPAVARDEITQLVQKRGQLLTTLEETRSRLRSLGITPEEAQVGEVELGFLIPRDIFQNDFDHFRNELKFLSRLVRLYSEAVTGETGTVTIGEISSSNPLLFLGMGVRAAKAIAETVKVLLETIKSTLEIRDLINKGKAAGIPEAALEGVSGEVEKRINAAIEERVQVAVKSIQDEQRKNELANGLTLVTRDLLARVERGMKVEIRVSLTPPDPENVDNERDADLVQLNTLSQELVFPRIAGEALTQISQQPANDE